MIDGASVSRANKLRASLPVSIHDMFNSSVLSNPNRAFDEFKPKVVKETPMHRDFKSILMPTSTEVHRSIVGKSQDQGVRNRTSRTIFLPALTEKKMILRDSIESERSVFIKN